MKKIFYYEMRKLAGKKSTIAMLVLMVALKILMSFFLTETYNVPVNVDMYEKYTKEIEGKYTKEKHEYIESLLERYSEIAYKEDEYTKQYLDKQISSEEYRKLTDEINIAKKSIPTLSYINEKSQYFSQCDADVRYFNDIGITGFLKENTVDFLAILLIMIITIKIFTNDDSKSTAVLVKTSKNGRQNLNLVRLTITGIIAATIGILFSAIELATFTFRYNIGDGAASIKSIMECAHFTFDISIEKFLAVFVFTKLFYCLVFALVCAAIAFLTKNVMTSYIAITAVILVPYVLSEIMPEFFKAMCIYLGFSKDLLYTAGACGNVPYFIISFIAAVLIGLSSLVILLNKNKN